MATTKLQADYASLVEEILGAQWGGKVRLGNSEEMKGSKRLLIYRCTLVESPAGKPNSVIVKHVNYSPPAGAHDEDTEITPAIINKDWAGLVFLNELDLAGTLVPRFYGGSKEIGLMVMEDLGSSDSNRLNLLLQGNDPLAAEAGLMALMRSVGRLHALTMGKMARYEAILTELGEIDRKDFELYSFEFLNPGFEKLAKQLEITLPAGAVEEMDQVYRLLKEPGDFLAFVHGDPCPDNCLLVEGEMRLFDFELGNFRHALLDGAYSRFHFPTCWCVNRLPEDLWRKMEAAYRVELVKGCPSAADDEVFYPALLAAGIGWSLGLCEWYDMPELFNKDFDWGTSTVRQRFMLRFDMVARSAAELGYFPVLGACFAEFAAKLRTYWLPETAEMPLYLPFR